MASSIRKTKNHSELKRRLASAPAETRASLEILSILRKPGKNSNDVPLEYEELTGQIISGAIEVHSTLAPGFVESIYQKAMEVELRLRGIPFEREKSIAVQYKGEKVGQHRLDFFVFSEIVVELKAVKRIENAHFAMVRSYLRASRRQHGLILNFSDTTLEPKRVKSRSWP